MQKRDLSTQGFHKQEGHYKAGRILGGCVLEGFVLSVWGVKHEDRGLPLTMHLHSVTLHFILCIVGKALPNDSINVLIKPDRFCLLTNQC
jgi:hypothetical protein